MVTKISGLITIWCDGAQANGVRCPRKIYNSSEPNAKRDAAKIGWYISKKEDLCPACIVEKLKKARDKNDAKDNL